MRKISSFHFEIVKIEHIHIAECNNEHAIAKANWTSSPGSLNTFMPLRLLVAKIVNSARSKILWAAFVLTE